MGIFPIIMNIVQFWLIDSIVKASAIAQDIVPTQDCDPLLSAHAADDNERPSATLETENRHRFISSLDSRDPEPHVVTSYQTITISDEQESAASSSRSLVDSYPYYIDRPSAQGSANSSPKSYPLVVPSHRFGDV
jgi:hypothetical protein